MTSKFGEEEKQNEPGAAGIREQPYDSQQNVSTFASTDTPASGACAESSSAACSETSGENRLETRACAASPISFVQGRMGRDCRKNSERARDSFRMSLLPAFAPRSRSRKRIPENAARAVGEIAPG
jgi:hypothetical protein